MNKLENRLKDIALTLDKKSICFGVHEKQFLNNLDKNINIEKCDLINSYIKGLKDEDGKPLKTLYIDRIRKKYKKKRIDYIIGSLEELDQYKRTFVKDSIYINKNTIYLYIKSLDYDLDVIVRRYKRYKVKIEIEKYSNGYLIVIDTTKAKTKWLMDKIYYIGDTIFNFSEIISETIIK